jgi:hypothetical protein
MRLRGRFGAGGPVGFGTGLGCAVAWVLVCGAGTVRAQQLIGYVSVRDADVSGATDVLNGKAVLAGSVSVTAKDRTAAITLGRGGTVNVCQTSVLHVTESRAAELAAPLLFSLDRGAIEIQMMATASDAVMTPDLRFAVRGGGPLDLRLRTARNGDTCVENRGTGAPTLAVSDPFGEALYELEPGQHVLFEHGSLHEVVDHETTPCGCPDNGMSVAEALLAPGVVPGAGEKDAPVQAAAAAPVAAEHPFPAAVSEGLAPPPEVPQAQPGVVHAQVSDTLVYNAPGVEQAAAPASAAPPPPAAAPAPPKVQKDPGQRDLVRVIGHFFRRMFGGK